MIDMSVGRVAAAYAANHTPGIPMGGIPMGGIPMGGTTTPLPGAAGTGAAAGAETDFGAFLDRQIGEAVATLKESERVSIAAVSGQASAQDVVRSVLAAEMTVQTVVAIRDKMVQAYQDIMRIAI